MKRMNFLYIIVSIVMVMNSCSTSKKILSYPNQVIALTSSDDGTITIRSTGTGKTEVTAVTDAEIKAFSTLLFQGLTSSVQIRPFVENESESKASHKKFYTDFFENVGYKSFVISSSNYTGTQRNQNLYYLNRDIKINLRALRTHLENNNIIRKFGY